MTTCEDVLCDNTCESIIPPTKFNLCEPEGAFGQITQLFVTNPGFPLTDENSAAEWQGRINMPDSNPAKIWRLLVIGDLPASESAEVEMSGDRTISGPEQRTLNVTIDEVNQENYDFHRATQCNKRFKVWYMAFGGDAYGGPEGIDMPLKFKHVITGNTNELQTLVAAGKWKSKIPPCRFMHPLFGDETGLES